MSCSQNFQLSPSQSIKRTLYQSKLRSQLYWCRKRLLADAEKEVEDEVSQFKKSRFESDIEIGFAGDWDSKNGHDINNISNIDFENTDLYFKNNNFLNNIDKNNKESESCNFLTDADEEILNCSENLLETNSDLNLSFISESDISTNSCDLDIDLESELEFVDNNSETDFNISSDEDDCNEERLDVNSGNDKINKYSCPTVKCAIKNWAYESRTPHINVELLLRYLKPFHPELPLCASTLLGTRWLPKHNIVNISSGKIMDEGKFVYFGIKKQLQKQINPALQKDKKIKVQYNIDGLKLYNSSNVEFWPILGKIFLIPDLYKSFPIAIYCGKGKQKVLEKYTDDFIEECNELIANGITVDGVHLDVEVMCILCDKPARSFAKAVKGHRGYFCCERCDEKGQIIKNCMVFLAVGKARTHESFVVIPR